MGCNHEECQDTAWLISCCTCKGHSVCALMHRQHLQTNYHIDVCGLFCLCWSILYILSYFLTYIGIFYYLVILVFNKIFSLSNLDFFYYTIKPHMNQIFITPHSQLSSVWYLFLLSALIHLHIIPYDLLLVLQQYIFIFNKFCIPKFGKCWLSHIIICVTIWLMFLSLSRKWVSKQASCLFFAHRWISRSSSVLDICTKKLSINIHTIRSW